MNPIARLIAKLKGLFVQDAADLADILTEGVIDLFQSAHDTLDNANELYHQAVDTICDDIEEWQAAIDEADVELASIHAGVAANERRKAKLADFLA